MESKDRDGRFFINRRTNSSASEVINLQLRKPKSWNWELATSKSSPDIAMPTIKLYDAKKRLLVVAKDVGTCIPHWNCFNKENVKGYRKYYGMAEDSLNPNVRQVPQHSVRKSHSDYFTRHNDRNRDVVHRSYTSVNKMQSYLGKNFSLKQKVNADNNTFGKNVDNQIQKSTSMVINQDKRHVSLQNTNHQVKRTRSNHIFQQVEKHKDESIKRAIADGYRKFITSTDTERVLQEGLFQDTDDDDTSIRLPETSKRNRRLKAEIRTTQAVPSHGVETKDLKHEKYSTRTSSAGTLLISEISVQDDNKIRTRRRQRTRRDSKTAGYEEGLTKDSDDNRRRQMEEFLKNTTGCDRSFRGSKQGCVEEGLQKQDQYAHEEHHRRKKKLSHSDKNRCLPSEYYRQAFYAKSFPYVDINCNHITRKVERTDGSLIGGDTELDQFLADYIERCWRRRSSQMDKQSELSCGNGSGQRKLREAFIWTKGGDKGKMHISLDEFY